MVYDIFYVSKNNIDEQDWKQFRLRFPSAQKIENVASFDDIKKKAFTKLFWVVWNDLNIVDTFKFDYKVSTWDQDYIHVWLNGESYDGVVLFSKESAPSEKEFEHRFYVNKKEIDIIASKPKAYPTFIINNYIEYQQALENSPSTMFWGIWSNIEIINDQIFKTYFSHHNSYDRNENHVFKNKCKDQESFINGVVLFSKNKPVSKKEIEHRFFIDKKEHDLVVSKYKPYDKFIIDKFEDYKHAIETAITDMFWFIPPEVEPLDDFKFDLQFLYQDNYERSINHVFKNKDVDDVKYNGIMLLSKQAPVSAREIEYRYLIEKKEYDVVASELKLYDIVFISYNEPNADENFANLIKRFPRAKRVHGVKGIHQAHIAAAKLATTPMFWVVDGDAVVEENFKFNLLLPKHDTDIVHVWLSKNPVNDLTYGYGGVKLLPKYLTENIDINQLDMTMSISNRFKVVKEVSNITAFNTDPFNTWKSAFRECVKLASRPVTEGYQEETEDRLITWCNDGVDRLYGEYALAGAQAGKQYGSENIANAEMLRKINNFDWLLERFQNQLTLVGAP